MMASGSVTLAAEPPVRTADEIETIKPLVVIRAGTVIPIDGKPIDDGMIVIADGKIDNIGRALEIPRNAKIIDATDQIVMPGIIVAHTRAGLPGYSRRGVHGNLTVADEFYPRPDQFEPMLDAGITTVAIVPAGSGIPGRALVVRTAGEPSQRRLVSPAYLRISASVKDLRSALEKAKAEIEKVDKAIAEHKKKQAEQAEKAKAKPPASQPASKPAGSQPASRPASQPVFKPPEIDPAYRPLVDWIKKKDGLRVLVEVRRASDVLHIAELLDEYELTCDWKLANGRQPDFAHVLDLLGKREDRLLMWALRSRVPYSAERLPLIQMLDDAGCEVSLLPGYDNGREAANLLPRLADLVHDGWDRDAALASITLNPARLLGIDDRVGSIKKDKQADLIFLDGDPLAPGTRVRRVMIAGQIVHTVENEKP